MRTTLIIAKTHDGKTVLVSGPEVPIVEQRDILRGALAAGGIHPDYCRLEYIDCEPDRIVKFRRPEQAAAETVKHEADTAAFQAAQQTQTTKKNRR